MKTKEELINQINEAFEQLKSYYEKSNDSLAIYDTTYNTTTRTMAYGPNVAEVAFNSMYAVINMLNNEDDVTLKKKMVTNMVGLLKLEPNDDLFNEIKNELAVINAAIEKDKANIAVVVAQKQ